MKNYKLILTIAFAITISSCKKNYISSQQNNPNLPSGAAASPQLILPGALKITAENINNLYPTYGIWMGYWAPSGNYSPSAGLVTYSFTTGDYQSFTQWYNNLSNYDAIQKLAAADASLVNYQAIAMIMKAYGFQALVDNYNDVPYKQAFQGLTALTPVYDKGSDIYDDLLVQLDAAIGLINKNTTAASPGSADIMFKGDMIKWKKLANTLKLRIAIRQYANVTAKDAALKTNIAATAGEGYLSSDANGANLVQGAVNPGYLNSDAYNGQESPFWLKYGFNQNGVPTGSAGNAYYRANNFAVNLLKANNDPRLNAFYLPISGAVIGNNYGNPNGISNVSVSAIGTGLLKSATMDAIVFPASEALFLQSEALVDGFAIPGDPQDLYKRGITASFVALGLTPAQAITYYSQDKVNVSWGSSTDKIQAIINQKYFAIMGYGNLEAYNEYRRTGFPLNIPVSVYPSSTVTKIPSRIFYPTAEYQQNAANVPAASTIDKFNSKIFWAKF